MVIETPLILGLDIGATYLRIGVGMSSGKVVACSGNIKWRKTGHYDCEILGMCEEIEDFLGRQNIRSCQLTDLGVAFAGNYDREMDRISHWPNHPTWGGKALRQTLSRRYHCHVKIDSDCRAAAMGHYVELKQKMDLENMLFFSWGTGVGGAVIDRGILLNGDHGWAGEFGHTIVQVGGPKCVCGNRGCLQAVLREPRVLEALEWKRKDYLKNGIASTDVPVLKDAIDHMALFLFNAVMMLDIANVVLAGGVFSTYGELLLNELDALVNEKLQLHYKKANFHLSTENEPSGVVGMIHIMSLISRSETK